MASLLGVGSMREGGIPLNTVEFVSMRKMWEVSGLLSTRRVGSTTWVASYKGRMGSTGGNGSTARVSLSRGRAILIEQEIGSTTWISLSGGRVGLTKGGI
jgi:hypothetical protein